MCLLNIVSSKPSVSSEPSEFSVSTYSSLFTAPFVSSEQMLFLPYLSPDPSESNVPSVSTVFTEISAFHVH